MKKLLSLLLALCMVFSLGVTAFAENEENSGSVGTVPVQVSALPARFSVTVPTALPIAVDADGNVTCEESGAAKVINDSTGPIEVTAVQLDAINGWTLVPFDTDYTAVKTGSKQFGFKLQDEMVPTTGVCNASNFGVIDGGGEVVIHYDATVAAQNTAVSGTIANLVFTIGWDKAAAATPIVPESPIASASIGNTVALGSLLVNGTAVKTNSTALVYSGGSMSFGDSGAADETINWIKVSDKLLIADRNLVKKISWNTINSAGYMSGKIVTIDGVSYKIRSLTSAEWNAYVESGSDNTWHYSECFTWTQTRDDSTGSYMHYSSSPGMASPTETGFGSIAGYEYAFRPVLEVVS